RSRECPSLRPRSSLRPGTPLPFAGGGTGQPQILAQGRALVLGAEDAALLQPRHDLPGEGLEATGLVGHLQGEPVGGTVLEPVLQTVRDLVRGSDEVAL